MTCFSFLQPRARPEQLRTASGSPSGSPSASPRSVCTPTSRKSKRVPDWCCFPRRNFSTDDQGKAHTRAAEGLQDIVQGYRKIAQLAFPPGAAMVVANLYRDITRLETVIKAVKFPKSRPWMLPLPEEQHDWERAYCDGGFLLRRQVCMASIGDEEWFLGGLFISDAGVVFDTGESPDESDVFQTSMLQWTSITEIVKPGPKAEITFRVAPGSANFDELHLQLTIPSDIEWIEEFWNLRSNHANYDMSIPSEHEVIRVPMPSSKPRFFENVLVPLALPVEKRRLPESEGTLLQRKLSRAKLSTIFAPESKVQEPRAEAKIHSFLALESTLSGVFADVPEGRKIVQIPNETPVCEERIYEATIEQLQAEVENDDFIPKVLKRSRNASGIGATKWTASRRSIGTFVRKAKFKIPLPQDFPKAVTKLVSIPTETNITAVYRLHPQDDTLVMTLQTCSHDVPYGEKFRVHETLLFKPLPSGGVLIEKWVEVMWIAPLPWTHGMLKSIIEQKTKTDAAKDLSCFVSVLQEVVSK